MREMKDSGIEWIGEIPVDWELNKIGSLYDERSVKVSDKDYQPLSVTKQGIVLQLETAAKTDNGDNRKLIKKNDFVINSRSDRRGSCGISEYDGSCSLINTVLQPRKNMCNAYYSFVFRSERFGDEFYRWGTGIVDDLWSTKWSNMKNIYIPFPSIEEQQKISAYLDTKCIKIDSIIEKQEKVIEKLKAYKLSVITEAVTKGLNPDVKVKDSGIEWIGEIPKGWGIKKFKYYFSIIGGNGFKEIFQGQQNGDIPFCKASDINGTNKYVNSAKNYVTKELAEQEKYNIIQPNSILIAKIGEALKKNHRKINTIPCIVDNNCEAFTLKEDDDINYLYYVMCIIDMIWFDNGGTIPSVNNEKLKNFFLPNPCVIDQQKISAYLDKKCSAIDKSIEQKQAIIEKLKEYKKSLIYEVVTGKKEV